jgi:hypothetical protein
MRFEFTLVRDVDADWLRLCLWTAANNGPIVHSSGDTMIMESHGGMILTGETEKLGEESVPIPLCPTQISHGLTRTRTQASEVRGRWLNAWVMARFPLVDSACVEPG